MQAMWIDRSFCTVALVSLQNLPGASLSSLVSALRHIGCADVASLIECRHGGAAMDASSSGSENGRDVAIELSEAFSLLTRALKLLGADDLSARRRFL